MIHSSERRDVGRKIPQGRTQTYYGGLDGLKALMCVQWLRKHMIIGICSGRWNFRSSSKGQGNNPCSLYRPVDNASVLKYNITCLTFLLLFLIKVSLPLNRDQKTPLGPSLSCEDPDLVGIKGHLALSTQISGTQHKTCQIYTC